jgi:hypothetical protein
MVLAGCAVGRRRRGEGGLVKNKKEMGGGVVFLLRVRGPFYP